MTSSITSMFQTPSPSDSSGTDGANDRATSFQPTEGGAEQKNGQTLMVEAYAVIWTILMVWLVMLWRKQATLNQRLDGLESAIVKASSRPAAEAPKPTAAKAPAGKLGGQPSS
jgi:CcmD family protein